MSQNGIQKEFEKAIIAYELEEAEELAHEAPWSSRNSRSGLAPAAIRIGDRAVVLAKRLVGVV